MHQTVTPAACHYMLQGSDLDVISTTIQPTLASITYRQVTSYFIIVRQSIFFTLTSLDYT